MVLKTEPLNSRRHIRSDFFCGQESLDHYIRKQASQDQKRRVSAVFVLIDEPNFHVLAYYTLSGYTVDVSVLDETFAKRLPRYPQMPATLLGRLAVDQSQKGKRLGELMLINALKRALEASSQVASLVVVAEALDDRASSFYSKYGFQAFRGNPLKLYFPMKSVEALCKKLNL